MNKLLHDTSSTWNWNFSLSLALFSLNVCSAVQCRFSQCLYVSIRVQWLILSLLFVAWIFFSFYFSWQKNNACRWSCTSDLVDVSLLHCYSCFIYASLCPACVCVSSTNKSPRTSSCYRFSFEPVLPLQPCNSACRAMEEELVFFFVIGKQQQQQQQQYHIYAIYTQTPI